jgi:hypothetical protein
MDVLGEGGKLAVQRVKILHQFVKPQTKIPALCPQSGCHGCCFG